MARDKEMEIVGALEMGTREQKKKANAAKIFQGKPTESTTKVTSGVTQENRQIIMKCKKASESQLIVDEFSLPENKKSIKNEPFTIIAPGKKPITEKMFEAKHRFPINDEEIKVASNELKRDESISNGETKEKSCSDKAKTLIIEVVESPSVKSGTKFVMTSEGLEGSKRNEKDGRAYFGIYNGDDKSKINDYGFPQTEVGFGQRHFEISYNLHRNAYLLKDLKDGTGTFIRIKNKKILTNSIIISFNKIHLSIIVAGDSIKGESDSELSVKSISKNSSVDHPIDSNT